jgi:hypothetical protein
MAAAVYLSIERPFSLAKRRAAEGLRAKSVAIARAV